MKEKKKDILLTAAIFLQKLATAAADIFWLVVLAELIGEAKSNGIGDIRKAAWYILCLILLSAWKRMGYNLGRSLTLKLQNRIHFRQNCLMVEKTARIPYRILEDYTFCRLADTLQENMHGRFVWNIVQQFSNFCLYCIKTLGLCILLGRARFSLGFLFFLLQICHILLIMLEKEQENTDAGMVKDSAQRRYLEGLALGYEGAGERSLFSYISFIGEKYDREAESFRSGALWASWAQAKTELANQVLMVMGYILTEIGLIALMMDGRIHFGYFIALSIGTYRCLNQIEEEEYVLGRLREMGIFLRQWNRFQHLPETEKGSEKSCKSCLAHDGFKILEFRNVSFRYPRTGRYVLQNLSFRMEKGGYYAFVGSNGSGKTTIVKLLSGLYDNYEGEILVNGIELREIPLEERREIFSVLFQDAARYQDTIIGNIFPQEIVSDESEMRMQIVSDKSEMRMRMVSDESGKRMRMVSDESGKRMRMVSDESGKRIQMVSDEAGRRMQAEKLAREWIILEKSRFPQGIDTFLGNMEDGVILSEGEWQRLLLCRMFAQPAQVRVMDEPMVSLDVFWQGRVYERITRGGEGETTLLFSHRMAAVRKAKRIFVLKEGTIAEEGTHEQLLEKRGLYAKMYDTQRCNWSEWL